MKRVLVMAFLLLCCSATISMAAGYNFVAPDQFRLWLESGKEMSIVDIQVPAEFQKHHFKGALETNAYPVKSADEKKKLDAVLPKLSATQNDVVVICPRGGGGAKNSYDYLKEKGIDEKRIFILKEGMQGWPYKELTVSGKQLEPFTVVTSNEVNAMINQKEPGLVVIDTRTAEEYQEVHIKGAMNIPLPLLEKDAALLTFPKDAKLVFYCNGFKCGKSPKAARIAAANGYSALYVLSEGMPAWEEKGFAIYAGPDYEKKIETTRIAPKDLQKMLSNSPASITLVDVRDAGEFAEGHIAGAINIPAANFAALSNTLSKEKKVIVYCNSGGRSYNAYRKLKKMAFSNIAQAIFADWQEAGLAVVK